MRRNDARHDRYGITLPTQYSKGTVAAIVRSNSTGGKAATKTRVESSAENEVHGQGQCNEGQHEVEPHAEIGPVATRYFHFSEPADDGSELLGRDDRDASADQQQAHSQPEREAALRR